MSAIINRKYRLHTKLRKQKITYCSSNKTIFILENTHSQSPDVLELQKKHKYHIQFIIPTP